MPQKVILDVDTGTDDADQDRFVKRLIETLGRRA
jgi:hypothetical protein